MIPFLSIKRWLKKGTGKWRFIFTMGFMWEYFWCNFIAHGVREKCTRLIAFTLLMRVQPNPTLIPDSPSYFFENSTHLWKLFQGKTFPKKCCIMLYIGFSDCFIATPEFQIFSAKSVMIVKVVRYLAKS